MSRKERLKVYHGIPKSITDNNTVFYASFDKSIKPEVYNGTIVESLNSIKPSVTGNGLIGGKSNLPNLTLPKSGTVEFWIDSNNLNYTNVMDIGGFRVYINNGTMTIQLRCYPSPTNIDYFYPVTSQIHHIRFVYSNANENFEYKIYINGLLKVQSSRSNWQLSLSTVPIKPSTTGILFGTTEDSYGCRAIISDLHISDIDRGDYFSTLPQDFIEDKAVVQHRMGQQQIKGDPMYNQETTDIVKIGTNVNEPYITCSRTSGNWANGDTIKIKGLSGELISGVFDTDTALARVTEPLNASVTIKVDSVAKLQVGDTIRFMAKDVSNSWTDGSTWTERVISSIDEEANTITIAQYHVIFDANQINRGVYIVETTTTSSSPIVKTSDGNNVVGTWTRLGLNEATFTLGTNSSLTTQDLYITYSLNIPPGNSDFTQLPYSVEKVYDEVGNELKSSSGIVLVDDFMSKIPGSMKECPHYISYQAGTSLIKPSNFTKDSYIGSYKSFYYLDSNSGSLVNSSSNGNISQLLLAFNLVDMLESKIGTIPGNKVNWLKNNIKSVTLKPYACGSGVSGNKVKCSVYLHDTKSWNNDDGWSHTNSTPKFIDKCGVSGSNISRVVGDDGFIYYVLSTNTTDTSTPSTITLDYASIHVSLNYDSSFEAFFVDNTRARELPCNPVLIQKQTKSVKRFLPSKECFSTEILYSDAKPTNGTLGDNVIYSYPLMYITTQGTGNYNSSSNDYFRECLAKLGFSKYSSYEFTNDIITNYKSFIGVDSPIRFQTVECDSYFAVNRNNIPKNFDFKGNFVALKPTLLNINNEIILNVYARVFKNGVSSDIVEQKNYTITNRPLIK